MSDTVVLVSITIRILSLSYAKTSQSRVEAFTKGRRVNNALLRTGQPDYFLETCAANDLHFHSPPKYFFFVMDDHLSAHRSPL
ncbi:hypothetical protein QCA50_014326 [Cerrena zonata]|uniref:Secreted protein n=1 Tax=Cerrena zonata TaxID=2478898 RepID=A0AAW0FNW7_9APHY